MLRNLVRSVVGLLKTGPKGRVQAISPGQAIAKAHPHVTPKLVPSIPLARLAPEAYGQSGISRIIQRNAPVFKSILSKPPARNMHTLRQPFSMASTIGKNAFRAGGRTAQMGYSPMARWTRARNFHTGLSQVSQAAQSNGYKLGGVGFLLATGLFGMQDEKTNPNAVNFQSVKNRALVESKLVKNQMVPIAMGTNDVQVELDVTLPFTRQEMDMLLPMERVWGLVDDCRLNSADLHHLSHHAPLGKWLTGLQTLGCTTTLTKDSKVKVLFPPGVTPLQVRALLRNQSGDFTLHVKKKNQVVIAPVASWHSDVSECDTSDLASVLSESDFSLLEVNDWRDVPGSERHLLISEAADMSASKFLAFVDELIANKNDVFLPF